MIACIFEHIQWRSALNDFIAHGYRKEPSESQELRRRAGLSDCRRWFMVARTLSGEEGVRLPLVHPVFRTKLDCH